MKAPSRGNLYTLGLPPSSKANRMILSMLTTEATLYAGSPLFSALQEEPLFVLRNIPVYVPANKATPGCAESGHQGIGEAVLRRKPCGAAVG